MNLLLDELIKDILISVNGFFEDEKGYCDVLISSATNENAATSEEISRYKGQVYNSDFYYDLSSKGLDTFKLLNDDLNETTLKQLLIVWPTKDIVKFCEEEKFYIIQRIISEILYNYYQKDRQPIIDILTDAIDTKKETISFYRTILNKLIKGTNTDITILQKRMDEINQKSKNECKEILEFDKPESLKFLRFLAYNEMIRYLKSRNNISRPKLKRVKKSKYEFDNGLKSLLEGYNHTIQCLIIYYLGTFHRIDDYYQVTKEEINKFLNKKPSNANTRENLVRFSNDLSSKGFLNDKKQRSYLNLFETILPLFTELKFNDIVEDLRSKIKEIKSYS